MIIKVNPEYIPLVQQRFCCVPCCVQWVLLRRNLPMISQENIAEYFDLRIPKKLNHLFLKNFSNKKGAWGGYGTAAQTDESLTKLFTDYKIPLTCERKLISQVNNPEKFIAQNLKNGNDILTDYHLHGVGKKFNNGHLAVISEIDTSKKTITLGDPNPKDPKFWKIRLSKFVKAMSDKWDGFERGFVIVKKK